MLTTPGIFKLAEALDRAGVKVPLSSGTRVGRGFADIGYEEFALLPGGDIVLDGRAQSQYLSARVVSLLTGEVRTLNEHEVQKLFVIPSVDQLLEIAFELKLGELIIAGGVLTGWEVSLVNQHMFNQHMFNQQSGNQQSGPLGATGSGDSLQEALLKLLIVAVGGELPHAKPRSLSTAQV